MVFPLMSALITKFLSRTHSPLRYPVALIANGIVNERERTSRNTRNSFCLACNFWSIFHYRIRVVFTWVSNVFLIRNRLKRKWIEGTYCSNRNNIGGICTRHATGSWVWKMSTVRLQSRRLYWQWCPHWSRISAIVFTHPPSRLLRPEKTGCHQCYKSENKAESATSFCF